VVKRTSSCPPGRVRSPTSGQWSLEWAKRHKFNDSEVPARPKPKVSKKSSFKRPSRVTKKKGNGYLRHCAHNLKRIARLSDKDRQEVIRALQRTLKQRRIVSDGSKAKETSNVVPSNSESQSSVNYDWHNWLVLHGNDKVVSEDVCDIGTVVGLKFKGDKNNMFDVLSRVGRKNNGGGGDGK